MIFVILFFAMFVEQVKNAERVQLSEIPLPAAPEETAGTLFCYILLCNILENYFFIVVHQVGY